MNLKQRLISVIFLVTFVICLTYFAISGVRDDIGSYLKLKYHHHHGRFHVKNISSIGQLNSVNAGDVSSEYENPMVRLKKQVHLTRKRFLQWLEYLQLNKKRKDISMDVLNEGEQRSCDHLTSIFMVSSALKHKTRRDVIRSTWINQTHWKSYNDARGVSFGMIFIVGRSTKKTEMESIMAESREHGDLLVLDLEESFYSLSYKVMIGFQWITDHCKGYKFLLKGDDDIFVNVHALMELLHESTTPQDHLYVGNTMNVAEVVRNGRYGVAREEYSRDNYPRYNSGGGFVLSSDVVADMIPHFNWVTPLKIDDAYMGGLVLRAGIDCINDKRFRMFDQGCVFRNRTIVSHTNDKIVIKPHCAQYLNNEALKDGLNSVDRNRT